MCDGDDNFQLLFRAINGKVGTGYLAEGSGVEVIEVEGDAYQDIIQSALVIAALVKEKELTRPNLLSERFG